MNSLLVLSMLLSVGYQCCWAGDDWKQFHTDMKTSLCVADKVDDSVLNKMSDCKKKYIFNPEKAEEIEKKMDAIDKECGEGKDDDLSAYTKVDKTNKANKRILMGYCSDSFRKCMKDRNEKSRKDGNNGEDSGECFKKLSQQQKDDFKKCMTDAVKTN